MNNHTPEPWYYDEGQLYSKLEGCVDLNEPRNIDRAVACAGINPKAVPDAVAALRGLLEGYERLLAQSVLDVNPGANRYSIAARAALAKLEATR